MYLTKIPQEKLQLSAIKNAILIDNQKFWSFNKSKNPGVRSAWFEVMSSLLQFAPFLLEKHEKQLTNNVFSQIDESDPVILGNLWTCVLLIQVKFSKWYTHLNLEAMVLPKLWKILKSASNSTVIYPHLLPFVSNFNSTTMPDEKLLKFYSNFFENIGCGMRSSNWSRSEISAISTAYYEILKYVTIQLVNNPDREEMQVQEICSRFLDDHLVAVIFWCLNTETLSGKYIFQHIAELINYWCVNSNEKPIYGFLVDRFWSELFLIFKSSLETNQNIVRITSSQVDLIQLLKNFSGNHQKSKGGRVKVKFSEISEDQAPTDSSVDENSKESKKLSFELQLNQLVYKLCDIYLEKITESNNNEFIPNLETLIKDYQSVEIFTHLAKSKNQTENICSLYEIFANWLLDEDLRCEAVIEIILVLYKYLRPTEKVDLLNRWIQVKVTRIK